MVVYRMGLGLDLGLKLGLGFRVRVRVRVRVLAGFFHFHLLVSAFVVVLMRVLSLLAFFVCSERPFDSTPTSLSLLQDLSVLSSSCSEFGGSRGGG